MVEGILNPDGSRNWQANILLDNVRRLETEKQELEQEIENLKQKITGILEEMDGRKEYERTQGINKL